MSSSAHSGPASANGPVTGPTSSRPSGPRNRWARVLGVTGLVVATSVVTAVLTYAVSHKDAAAPRQGNVSPSSPAASVSPSSPAAPSYSPAEQAAAKDRLCHVFDQSARGQSGQGGVRAHGELNVPVVLRAVNGALAVQNSLTPAVPTDVANTARKFIETSLDLTTAAMGPTTNEELTRLNNIANTATLALVDACGLPR